MKPDRPSKYIIQKMEIVVHQISVELKNMNIFQNLHLSNKKLSKFLSWLNNLGKITFYFNSYKLLEQQWTISNFLKKIMKYYE